MQNEIIYKLKESYYGWQYALSLLDFLNMTYNDLDGAIQALENKQTKKEDILRLEVFKYQLAEKKIEIEKNIRLAKIAINFYIGNDFSVDDSIAIKNERDWIELDKRELRSFEYYLSLMKREFPDLLKVSKGLEAKNELLLNEKKSALPVFGGMVKYDYAFTDQRTSQKNPFNYDPYNHNTLALGVGLTWNIDFGVNQSKQDKIFIEISELQSKQHFAQDGLKLLLNKSYMEVSEAENRALTLQKAYKSAKKWLTNIGTSVSLGLTPAKDIIDAYTTRAIVYKDYYEAIYNYQLAWAKLSESTGVEVDPILTH
jgi:outer membrane protein TolC